MKTKPNVPSVLPQDIPQRYRLGVDGWSFPEEKLEEKLKDGTRKLLTLDVSISPDEFVTLVNQGSIEGLADRVNEHYPLICKNNCPGCFEKGDVRNYLISWDEVKKHVLEPALELGLESVKFLGPGELFANPDLFKILDYLQQRNIKIGIFTKGETPSNEELARKYYGMSFLELVKRACSYDIARLLIHYKADRTIEVAVDQGMNSDLFCQRMSLQSNPVTPRNIDEVLNIFIWGTERNIPVCVTPTMVSGMGYDLVEEAQQPDFQEKLIQLYTDIYDYLIKRGVMTLKQLQQEGISSYAGIMPCNQLSSGMFIRKDGVVQSCPGNDGAEFSIAQDIRTMPLREIWTQSRNYALEPTFNNRCVKDGYSIPNRLYDEVLRRVEARAD